MAADRQQPARTSAYPVKTRMMPVLNKSRECDIDQMLRRKLNKIFREHRLTSFEIGRLLHADEHAEALKVIALTKQFSEKELENLSILWIAILGSYNKSAQILLRSGAVDLNEPYGLQEANHRIDLNKNSSILHALLLMYPSLDNEELIRLAIDQGADLLSRDSYGRTALHFAVRRNNRVQLIEMLLEKGADADVNVADNNGETPLLAAATSIESDKLIRLLIRYGADVTVKDRFNQNLLHGRLKLAPVEDIELARVLIEKGVSLEDREYYYKYQPIHMAAARGDHKLVELYLDCGANVNALGGERDECPLYLAAEYRRPTSFLKTLLKRGADINRRTAYDGRTALHEVCKHYDEDSIKLLLSAGADMFVEDRNGDTAFVTLVTGRGIKNSCVRLAIKLLALKMAWLQASIELKAQTIIEQYPSLWTYYRDCVKEMEAAKSTKFIETCTFLDLLTKCQCQIAALMRNRQFKKKFLLYEGREIFPVYYDDMFSAFGRARKNYRSMLQQEDVIDEAIYDILPYMVVKKIAHYIISDCCSDWFISKTNFKKLN